MLKEVCTDGSMAGLSVFRDTCRPTGGMDVDAVDCEAGIPPSRSLKYSESLREELKPSRSSTLPLTSTKGQS